MSIEDQIKEAMCRMLNRLGIKAIEVTGWDESSYADFGGCATCGPGPTDYEVDIMYKLEGEIHTRFYSYTNSFGNLIKELT